MLAFLWALTIGLTALSVHATSEWCDSQTEICFQRYFFESLEISWNYLFPPAGQSTDEFIAMFTAPVSVGWIGNSLRGPMTNSLLVVAWTNEGKSLVSPRLTPRLTDPPVYTGPTLTVLGTSGVNATHQRIVYRCQNCTSWDGGSIPENGTYFGYAAHGSSKPPDPQDPDSSLNQHTLAGQHEVDIPAARSDNYQTYLQMLLDLPTESPSPTTTPTTTTSPTPTPTGPLTCPGVPQPSYAMVAAPGFRATPVLGGLTQPRGIAIDDRGNLLVIERTRGITIHTLDSTGCVTSSKMLISDTSFNHGIDVVGNRLFASSLTTAWVWDYDSAAQAANNKRTIITGMNPGGHPTRTVWLSRQHPNYLLVSQGSQTNIDIDSFQPSTARAIVKVFDLNASTTYDYTAGGRVLGYGLRNDVGVTEDRAGNIVTVENSMDNAYRLVNGQRTDVHNDNPAEIVWNLGNPANPSGAFHGYPYCFFVWEPSNFVDKAFKVGDWFVQEPEAGRDDAWCSQQVSKKPLALLPPHSAPLDTKFGVGNDTNLYVGLHGSWNRNPPQGYKVVAIPGEYSSNGEWTASVSLESREYQNILGNMNESSCASGCFRPVGLSWSADGRNLYVASDTTGEIFLVQKNGSGEEPPITTTTTTTTSSSSSSTTTSTSTTSTAPEPTQSLWGQCGGNGYTGPTACPSGSVCTYLNDWYSQCIPA